MKYASDFKQIALDALAGKWLIAIVVSFLAALLGTSMIIYDSYSGIGNAASKFNDLFQSVQADELLVPLQKYLIVLAVIYAIGIIVMISIGGVIKLGYATFNLKLVDKKDVKLSDLFSQFHQFKNGFCMNILVGLYIALWSLLFVIPGLIKQFSYAMAPYLLAENPNMTASEAITESRRIMDGNKWRLFCLGFSFIGWELVCSIPLMGVTVFVTSSYIVSGNIAVWLWFVFAVIVSAVGVRILRAYQEAAYAAFYRDITQVTEMEEK